MNRGYNGNDIFAGNENKARFLEFLEGTAKKLKIHSKYEKKKENGGGLEKIPANFARFNAPPPE